jgi:long-chain acyl-CoA synthetase
MVIGERKPYLSAICILSPDLWEGFAGTLGIDPREPRVLERPEVENAVLERIGEQVKLFPGYARILRVHLSFDPWTVENGLLTPTLKLKRSKVMEQLAEPLAKLYAGH